MTKYIAKKFTWFIEGTVAELIDDYRVGEPSWDMGLFRGARRCENQKSENRPLGEEHMDEEVCSFDEFDVVEE
jgi:hypothetical protein